MNRALLVGLGGFAGSAARYLVASAVQRWHGDPFPMGTLAVNVAGSFVLGVVLALSLRGVLGDNLRFLLGVGLCGGFTTMSAFSYETLALVDGGHYAAAAGNVGVTFAACIAAAWLGTAAVRLW